MNNEHLQELSELESEFRQEARGSFSLSPYIGNDKSDFSPDTLRNEEFYVGYDIHPENLEALYFEGLKLPRWGELPAKNTAQRVKNHEKSFQETTADYPLMSRIKDVRWKVAYAPEEVLQLREECERALGATDDTKAVRALQKFYIACTKASEHRTGLLLLPS